MENRDLERRALYYKAMEDYRIGGKDKNEEAYYFLMEASKLESPEADKLLGVLYMSGQYAPYPAKDAIKAASCFEAAALAGDEEAMFWLSQCYDMGLGVEKDPEKAQEWKQKALDAGFEAAETEEEAQEVLQEIPEEEEFMMLPEEETEESAEEISEPEEEAEQEDNQETEKTPEITEDPKIPAYAKAISRTEKDGKDISETAENPVNASVFSLDTEEKAADYDKAFEAGVQEKNRMRSVKIPFIYGGIGAVSVLAAVWIIGVTLYIALRPGTDADAEGFRKSFYLAAGIFSLLGAAIGGWLGFGKGKKKADTVNMYEGSAFYKGFQGMEPAEKEKSTQYLIYSELKRFYQPMKFRDPLGTDKVIEGMKGRQGILLPGWCFQTKRGFARPEYVIISEKAMFVIHVLDLVGRLSGDVKEALWTLRWDNHDKNSAAQGAETVSQTVPNLIEENEYAMEIVRTEIQLMDPLPVETIPSYNVLLFPAGLDIRGVRFALAGSEVMMVQGGADKLLTQIRIKESMLPPHQVDMETLIQVLDRLGSKQTQRQSERAERTSFRAMNQADFK